MLETEDTDRQKRCSSLNEAVHRIEAYTGIWKYYHPPDGCVRVNPDWQKWSEMAASDTLNELSCFCDPPLTIDGRKVYYGLTCQNVEMLLTNPPPWPSMTELAKSWQPATVSTNSVQTP